MNIGLPDKETVAERKEWGALLDPKYKTVINCVQNRNKLINQTKPNTQKKKKKKEEADNGGCFHIRSVDGHQALCHDQ